MSRYAESESTAGASITLKALTLGAFDFVAKPTDVAARIDHGRFYSYMERTDGTR